MTKTTVCMYICMYVRTYVCMYVCMSVCTYVHIVCITVLMCEYYSCTCYLSNMLDLQCSCVCVTMPHTR